jgi:hypothetical protein
MRAATKQNWPIGALVIALFLPLVLAAQGPSSFRGQRGFESPQAAADALIAAADAFNVDELYAVLGRESQDLIASGDTTQDKNRATAFAAKAKQKQRLELSPQNNPRKATLLVGEEEWPLPLPIVSRGGKWYFDTKKGRTAILERRIGGNELDALSVCRRYVDAQRAYAAQLHDGATVNQYAQKIISTPGKQDGLVWRNPDGSLGGPISEGVAKAIAQGYSGSAEPFHGYYFKILKGQGPAAPLGRLDFVVSGMMIGGFALVATPADYGVTGVQTFLVSHDGVVYQKDLGPKTLALFEKMERYNPDKTWRVTNDAWPEPLASAAPSRQ